MIISESWLREWVDPAISTDELASLMTLAGLEVETIERVIPLGKGVVIGEVVAIEKHPDADKLNVCTVSIGAEPLTIVCGAPNAALGIKAPVALVGSSLPNGMAIESRAVRGVTSSGMLCSESELGLSDASSGLMLLDREALVGQELDQYLKLDDACIDIDLTPNRGDCLSHAGIAREVAVLSESELTPPTWNAVKPMHDHVRTLTLAAPADCPRYVGRIISNVNLDARTPDWMKEKLRRAGHRSIAPVVDVTNYVMLELGQPMHAFDLNKIEGGITVRRAEAGEKLVLLDDQEIGLMPDALVIADDNKAVALAGIMGGLDSGISAGTTDILLESAFFSPESMAGQARKLGLNTDASHRFERGVDVGLQRRACERATQLLLEMVGGKAGPLFEAIDQAYMPAVDAIQLRADHVERMLGLSIEDQVFEDNLTRLGMSVEKVTTREWSVTPPSWRFDVTGEHDLVEEMGRTIGYDSIGVNPPQLRGELHHQPEQQVLSYQIKQWMASASFHEIISYSFVDPTLQRLIDKNHPAVNLGNPIAENMSQMRFSLMTGLLETVRSNLQRQQQRVRLFEVGHVFEPDTQSDTGARETQKLGAAISGQANAVQWGLAPRPIDFYDLKGDLETLFGRLGKQAALSFRASSHPALHPGQCADVLFNDQVIGVIGAVHPSVLKGFDIDHDTLVFELDMECLLSGLLPQFEAVSRYPETSRDIAIVLNKGIPVDQITTEISAKNDGLLKKVALFDIYTGDRVGEDEHSLAFKLTYQSQQGSLEAAQVDKLVGEIVSSLEARFQARLRS